MFPLSAMPTSLNTSLSYEIWDEYTRRQYLSKAPDRNPYGDDEEPLKFRDFYVLTKIRFLHQLTVWTLWNPDRIRERMPDHQKESDQLDWVRSPVASDVANTDTMSTAYRRDWLRP